MVTPMTGMTLVTPMTLVTVIPPSTANIITASDPAHP